MQRILDFMHIKKQPSQGFTLLELVIVVAIIGILAVITYVSYGSVQKHAVDTSLMSDLSNASDQLVIDSTKSSTDSFPSTLNEANNNTGIPASKGTTYPTYTVNNTGTPKTFCLAATKSDQTFFITQEGKPMPGPCPVLYLDAGIATSYPETGTDWYDLSGNGNNAVLVGGAYKENNYMVCDGTDGGNNDYIEVSNSAASSFFNNPSDLTMVIVAQLNRESGLWGTGDLNVYGHIIGKGRGDGYQGNYNTYSLYYDARNNNMFTSMYRGTPATQHPDSIPEYRFVNNWSDAQAAYNWGDKFMMFFSIKSDGNVSYHWYRAGKSEISGNGTYTTGGSFDNAYNLRVCADYAGRYNKQRTWMVAFYNQALSDSDIQKLYESLHSRFGM